MSVTTTLCHLHTLPPEVVSYALTYLPLTELGPRLDDVCRHWRVLGRRSSAMQRLRSVGGIYVVGGINHTLKQNIMSLSDPVCPCSKLRHFLRYDGEEWNTVDESGGLREGRYHCGVAVWDRKIYVVGGRNMKQRLKSVEVYDVVAGTWSQLPSMPTVRSAPTCVVVKGILYVFGGYDGQQEHATVDRFDIAQNRWVDKQHYPKATEVTMPEASCELSACVFKNDVYLVGGTQRRHQHNERVLSTVYKFSPDHNTWEEMPPLTSRRMCPAVVATSSGSIMVLGGGDGVGALDTIEMWTPGDVSSGPAAAGSFAQSPVVLRTSRANATAAEWNGVTYVPGGFYLGEGGPLASVELIDVHRRSTAQLPSMPERRDACKVVAVD